MTAHFKNRLVHSRVGARLIGLSFPLLIDRAIIVIALIALVGLTSQSIQLYQEIRLFTDMAYFDQSVFALLNGAGLDSIGAFGRRFNPILAALVPLYAIWPDPRTLLLLQSIGLVATIFPLYWTARPRIGYFLSLLMVIVYLASPIVQVVNKTNFAEIKLAIPLLSFALFFLLRGRYIALFICLGVALILKQEVAIICTGFAAYLFFAKRKLLGLAILSLSLGLFLLIVLFVYPSLYQGEYSVFSERYGYLGNSLDRIVVSLIQKPQVVLEHLWIPEKIQFALYLLSPLAFLSLVGAEIMLISLPIWGYTLLSDFAQQYAVGQYYQAPFAPFLFFGAVLGLERLLRLQIGGTKASISKLALGALLISSSQLYLPTTWARILDPTAFVTTEHSVLGYQLLAQIPAKSMVVAQTEFVVPLIAARKYQVVELSPHDDYRQADYLIGDSTRPWYTYRKDTWEHWRASGYFDSIVERDGYFLLQKKTIIDPASQVDNGWALLGKTNNINSFNIPAGLRFENALTFVGYARVPSGRVRAGEKLRLVAEWRADEKSQKNYIVLARVMDTQGHVWAEDDRQPIISTELWSMGDIVRDEYDLSLPSFMPPGEYRFSLGVWDPGVERRLSITDSRGNGKGIETDVAVVRIDKAAETTPASYIAIESPKYVDMNEIRFLGNSPLPETLAPGESFQIGLYWRARAKPRGDYLVAVQLRDANDRVAFEQSARPAADSYPTTQWDEGEVLLDWHDLTIPNSLPPGDYQIFIALREFSSNRELGNAKIGTISVQ